MARKIFLLSLVILLIQGVVFAKKKSVEIPMESRAKVFVDVIDSTNFLELDTAEILRDMLIAQLNEKNIFNIVNPTPEHSFADIKSLGDKRGASDVGEMLLFNPVRVTDSNNAVDFDKNFYRNRGAQYVLRCDILGLGNTQEFTDKYDLEPGIGIGIGSGGGFGVGIVGGVPGTKRTVFSTVVNMQFIDVESGIVIFRYNAVGQEMKHKKPRQGYDDANDEAYLKSLRKSASQITKRVSNYTSKHLIKQDDK